KLPTSPEPRRESSISWTFEVTQNSARPRSDGTDGVGSRSHLHKHHGVGNCYARALIIVRANRVDTRSRQGHRLLQIGVALFLFTSFEGFAIPHFAAPNLGRSVHTLSASRVSCSLGSGCYGRGSTSVS